MIPGARASSISSWCRRGAIRGGEPLLDDWRERVAQAFFLLGRLVLGLIKLAGRLLGARVAGCLALAARAKHAQTTQHEPGG